MTDFPSGNTPLPLFINVWSRYGAGLETRYQSGGLTIASSAWPAANLAIYIPFWLPFPYPVQRLYWSNGSAAGDNWDAAIYTKGGAKLYSPGSTGGSGNSASQYVTPGTPFVIGPGRYYWGISHSSTTANRAYASATPSVAVLRMMGVLQEALGSIALPSNMTPVAPANAFLPTVGMTRTPSGF